MEEKIVVLTSGKKMLSKSEIVGGRNDRTIYSTDITLEKKIREWGDG